MLNLCVHVHIAWAMFITSLQVPMELEVRAVGICPMWALKTKPRSSWASIKYSQAGSRLSKPASLFFLSDFKRERQLHWTRLFSQTFYIYALRGMREHMHAQPCLKIFGTSSNYNVSSIYKERFCSQNHLSTDSENLSVRLQSNTFPVLNFIH